MPDQDFLFALDVAGGPESDQMLAELTRTVLAQCGYAAPAIDALTDELRAALAERIADGKRLCDVRFRAQAGQLEIVVRGAGRPDWRTIRPLPVS